MKVVESKL